MKILLGIAPYTFDETYPLLMDRPSGKKGGSLIQGPTPCLGLLYMASALKKGGHRVAYFEGAFYSTRELKTLIGKEEPELLGFLITAPFWDSSKEVIKEVKRAFTNVRIIVGGRHADLMQENLLFDCPEVDFVCFGDGEVVLKNLCDCIQSNGEYERVNGIAYKKDASIKKNLPQEPFDPLDDIDFPDYSLIEMDRYAPSIGQYLRLPNMTMLGSRGCVYNCLFCASSQSVRVRGVSNIIDEIELLVGRYGVRDILFYDENFVGPSEKKADVERVDEFCSRIIEKGFNLTWSGNARPDHIEQISDKLLRKMKKAGCWKLLFGLESGVQKNLDTLRKEFTVVQSKAAVERVAKFGIRPFCNFIFGIPGETYEEGLNTIDFACSLKGAEFIKFLTYTPFPGSEVYMEIEKYGRIIAPLAKMTVNNLTFVPHSMTKVQIEELYQRGIASFYRRPQYILQRLLHMRSIEDLKQNWRGFQAFAYPRKKEPGCTKRN